MYHMYLYCAVIGNCKMKITNSFGFYKLYMEQESEENAYTRFFHR